MLFNWIVGGIRLAENKKTLKEFKEEQLKNEKFRDEYKSIQPEWYKIRAFVKIIGNKNQKQLKNGHFDDNNVEIQKNHDIIFKNTRIEIISGKGKSSMRDYNNMNDEQFLNAYSKPYTEAERKERYERVKQEIEEGKTVDFTDELIDEIFSKYE